VADGAAPSNLLAAPTGVTDVDGFDSLGIIAELDSVATTFQAATGSIEQHLILVDTAGSDILATSGALDEAAATASRRELKIRGWRGPRT